MAGRQNKKGKISERTVWVYFQNEEIVQRLKEIADREGESVSGFVKRLVLRYLSEEYEERRRAEEELAEKLGALEEENARLMEENRYLRLAVKKLEEDVRRLTVDAMSPRAGMRRFSRDVVEFLRERGKGTLDEILRYAGVNVEDTVAREAIVRQLEALAGYGVVKYDGRWWRWVDGAHS